jgi:GNAT-family acetyltransferase (TIGR03103 family)
MSTNQESATRPEECSRSDDPREQVGPGGDPVVVDEAAGRGSDGQEVVLDCGWGRLVFGQTFTNPEAVANVLRSEADGSRDICIYLQDPHVLVAQMPDELFLDPSLTYRLILSPSCLEDLELPRGLTVRLLRNHADADAVNAIYVRNGMIPAPVDALVVNATKSHFLHLIAESADGRAIGTITGIDHVELFGDPLNGSSLWCLTVDQTCAPPGTGQALLQELAHRLADRGREFVDLSVLAENKGAIRLYERLGFRRTAALCLKRKNPINERLFRASLPDGYDGLNPYARIVVDEAMRRGVRVEVLDPGWGELRLTHGGRTLVTRESLSELTSAVAMSRCDDKRVTRRVLATAGLAVPSGRTASGGEEDEEFLAEAGALVVKPARGEQGLGITVGVTNPEELHTAVATAGEYCPDVLLEQLCQGEDLRVVVIDNEVAAAAVRRPASVVGDGIHSVATLIELQSRRREAATKGESRIPLDAVTEDVVRAAGYALDDVLPEGVTLHVRRTANLHTGGTLHDVTPELHPDIAAACIQASQVLAIPVVGLDLLVQSPGRPEHVFIEANERPGLANHEPQPTAERFVDLLFPGTQKPQRLWTPPGPPSGSEDPA